jgi:hypothetical protein
MRVLLVNPYLAYRRNNADCPHLGLILLGTILTENGHQVQVVDYNYTPEAPMVADWLTRFQPDLVAVSLYTAYMRSARAIIAQVRQLS